MDEGGHEQKQLALALDTHSKIAELGNRMGEVELKLKEVLRVVTNLLEMDTIRNNVVLQSQIKQKETVGETLTRVLNEQEKPGDEQTMTDQSDADPSTPKNQGTKRSLEMAMETSGYEVFGYD